MLILTCNILSLLANWQWLESNYNYYPSNLRSEEILLQKL